MYLIFNGNDMNLTPIPRDVISTYHLTIESEHMF
jgi:hypothetical protein